LAVDLVLRNVKVYTSEGIIEAGVAIDEEKIVKLAKEVNLPRSSERIDLKGNILLPGLIDLHVHLRDQQLSYKEDFLSGTSAAAAGGVTLVADMPNNKPVTMDAKSLKERMKLAENRIIVNVAFHSAFPKELEEIQTIVSEGAMAFKLYLSQRIGGIEIEDDDALINALKKAGEMKTRVAVHAEDMKMLESIKKETLRSGRDDLEAYLKVHSPQTETQAIERMTQLMKRSDAHVHFCHVSSASGLDALSAARNTGISITCEVTPHHLFLSSKDFDRCGTIALTDPPLRTKSDVESLWSALREGFIDAVASDHAPHTMEEKEAESIWDVKPGIPGLETMLPLLFTQLSKRALTLSDLVRLTSEKPAEILHLKDRGSIREGYYADFVVVDTHQEYRIDSSEFHSKAKYSPFDGWKVRGKPIKTFVNGQLIMDEGEIVAKPGTGRIIR